MTHSVQNSESLQRTSCAAEITSASTREDVARFLIANRSLIQRRIKGKLREASYGRSRGTCLVDPDDVMSSLVRRVDLAMAAGTLRLQSEREFWAYVWAIADNVTVTKIRSESVRHAAPSLNPMSPEQADATERLALEVSEIQEEIKAQLSAENDRELIHWKLRGAPFVAVAAATGRTEGSLRTHWARLCRFLRKGRAGKSALRTSST